MRATGYIFNRYFLLLAVLVFIGVGLKYRYYIRWYAIRLSDKIELFFNDEPRQNLTSFGIPIPEKYIVHGIDVSRYQKEIDWESVHKMKVSGDSISFVFIKATEGTDLIDAHFENNWESIKEHRLLRGAYHFFHPGNDAAVQAKLFMRTVKLKKGDLPPVLDLEVTDGEDHKTIREGVQKWLSVVEKKYKAKPILYSNYSFYRNYLEGHFDHYPLWIAHYYRNELKMPEDKTWVMWQHNDRGQVNGITGRVDFNVFNGSYDELCGMCIK